MSTQQLKQCIKALDCRIKELEGVVDSDDQQISLTGNILTLEDGGTVDLSAFLDDTDDQIITNFSLAGNVLTLTIQDGNTVTVDLASLDTDTDDQTLSLAGTILTIADGNSVDLASIDTDDQTLSTTTGANGATTSITIADGNTVAITHPAPPTLTTTTRTVYVEEYAGGPNTNTGAVWTRNATVTRVGVGRWQVRFATAHPDGANYHVSFSGQEENNVRDNPKITIEQGTKNAAGFDVMLTQDDNGGSADIFTDYPWSFGVDSPVVLLETAVLV